MAAPGTWQRAWAPKQSKMAAGVQAAVCKTKTLTLKAFGNAFLEPGKIMPQSAQALRTDIAGGLRRLVQPSGHVQNVASTTESFRFIVGVSCPPWQQIKLPVDGMHRRRDRGGRGRDQHMYLWRIRQNVVKMPKVRTPTAIMWVPWFCPCDIDSDARGARPKFCFHSSQGLWRTACCASAGFRLT